MEISGYICVRNAVTLDYCLKEAAISMIPVVSELIICDGESDDGTEDIINELIGMDARVRKVTYPWKNPVREIGWWVDWLNFARGHCSHPMQITLDADEVLDPISYNTIRSVAAKGECAMFQRHNYWKDPQHLVPFNKCCGEMVARLGPTSHYMPSDEPYPKEKPNVRSRAQQHQDLFIHHLGFLRKNEAFVKKAAVVQNAFFGSVDERIEKATEGGKRWDDFDYFGEPLRDAPMKTPELCHRWLKDRGYSP